MTSMLREQAVGKKLLTITLFQGLLERALEELPEGSEVAGDIRKALEATACESDVEPIAYLAHRRAGPAAGKKFVARSQSVYDPQVYEGPYPVFAEPAKSCDCP